MGQKANPTSLRLGVNRTWDSRWYADDNYAGYLHEDVKIKEFLKKKLAQAGISRIVIERPAKKARVTIHSARPGVVIGKKGQDIEALRKEIQSMTAANFKARAYSPVSGIMQSVFLLLFMLLLAPAAKYIPLACLSAVLVLIGWNMMGLGKIFKLLQGPRGDRYTLVVTLLLTVLVDLNTAISVGFIMASIIFMHRMSREIEIETDEQVLEEDGGGRDLTQVLHEKGVMSLRLSGPLFFGGASQVSHFFQKIGEAPKVLILRMGYVPVVDATGANIIIEFIKKVKKYDTKIILSNVKKQPRRVLHNAFLKEGIDFHTISIASSFQNALKITRRYLKNKEQEEKLPAAEKTEENV